jgi:HSP20 family protein
MCLYCHAYIVQSLKKSQMQTLKALSKTRTLSNTCQIAKAIAVTTTHRRTMSLWPQSFISDDDTSPFSALSRFLDDYGDYRSTLRPQNRNLGTRTFAPKFNVRELPDHYELEGELPGIEQKDIEIEFSDRSTLTVRGKTERSYTAGTPPTGFIEGPASQGAIESGQDTAQKPSEKQVTKEQEKRSDEGKYWVSERSLGEFSRSFSFPQSIDQDQVQASLKSGILSIIVPKARKQDKRKITIS